MKKIWEGAENRGAIEKGLVINRIGFVLGIALLLMFYYQVFWIGQLGHRPLTHREICLWAIGLFGPALAGLSIFRHFLKKKYRDSQDPGDLRRIQLRLYSNTFYIICCYAILFFHLFQYIRILMGWVEYPE
ncbi:MAG: hypothetical protein H6624_09540 [Bdellovibrionaceae bacterium]|nr:hypothetical protein [Bdellovibrionales bacterium]MCB9084578.1 hypothetical protein [Pseudobdellovibrionaceae bacterium]